MHIFFGPVLFCHGTSLSLLTTLIMILRNGKKYNNSKPQARISTSNNNLQSNITSHSSYTLNSFKPSVQSSNTKQQKNLNNTCNKFNSSFRGYPKVLPCSASK